jgi:acyl dehydratase/NADP-dependent 3-hydroxy acid dehydrogenase YdfG
LRVGIGYSGPDVDDVGCGDRLDRRLVLNASMTSDLPAVLASKTFSTEDQERFADLSGDRNPMHMDPVAARRTQAGAAVVHGMHLVLWCLDVAARQGLRRPDPRALQARFMKPVYVGDTPSIRLVRRTTDDVSLRVEIDGTTLATLRVSCADPPARPAVEHRHGGAGHAMEDRPAARELDLGDIPGRSGLVRGATTAHAVAAAFPAAADWIEPSRIRGLASLSYLVGMECPGLHSIFGTLSVDFVPVPDAAGIDYAVTEIDERFRLVHMRIEGCGLAGTVQAFLRHPPVRQMSFAAAAAYVSPAEFAGQRALIVGGSRGLGELTAKLIAAGGGHPIITYARGAADADAVRREIAKLGARCEILHYDATLPAAPQLTALRDRPTHVYYFATSQIFRRKTGLFEVAALRDFLAVYVSGFYDLCAALAPSSAAGLSIFYPSSVAVDERPRDLTEYAMAKAAGEILCADIGRFMPGLRVTVRRLPRLLSDQTATVSSVETMPAVDVLLPIIREVQAAPTPDMTAVTVRDR